MPNNSPWKFRKRLLTLSLSLEGVPNGGRGYYIDLAQCQTSAEMLDWIMQVAGKDWATDWVLASLVRDLNRLLIPQRTLCASGQERGPIDVRRVLRANRAI